MKRHNAIEMQQKQWNAEVDKMCKKYDAELGVRDYGLEDMRAILAELNSGRPPMVRDLVWAMKFGDKVKIVKVSFVENCL